MVALTMSTPITVGKARLATISVSAGSTPDTTTAVQAQTGNANTLKVKMNPNDNRQVGALGVAPATAVNATVTIPGHSTFETFAVSAAATPPAADTISLSAFGPEIDPPDWLLA